MTQGKMSERIHGNPRAYREYEARVGREVLLPLLKKWGWSPPGKRVIELGCAEAGLLDAFHEAGCEVAGVELNQARADQARKLAPFDLTVHVGDITRPDLTERVAGNWDLVILRDVIEHLGDKEQTLRNIKNLFSPGGQLYLETLPWFMPFGGHQQAMNSRFRYVPWLHLLPRKTYKNFLLHTLKQDPALVEDMVEGTYDRGITMRGLNRLIEKTGFTIDREHLYFINPAYRIRFGFPEIKWPFNSRFPVLPEFAATSVAMLLSAKR
jgi:2-polyprenyl-3-methyl-5-hydroxy-6-metoxy-1,4-benzoquinol methylase